MESLFEITKKCVKCQQEKTLDQFHKCKTNKDGLQYWCKECRSEFHQKNYNYKRLVVKKGYKFCPKCKLEKPLDEFHKNKTLLYKRNCYCIECKKKRYIEKRQKYLELNPIPIPKEGYKFCSVCKEEKLLTEFYKNRLTRDGLSCGCKSCNNIKHKEYYKKNKKKCDERNKKWRLVNPQKTKAWKLKWMKTEKGKTYNSLSNNRHKYKNTTNSLTAQDWEDIKMSQDFKCAYCGEIKPLHRDHIIPASKGGGFTKNNVQGLCRKCNTAKSNKIDNLGFQMILKNEVSNV